MVDLDVQLGFRSTGQSETRQPLLFVMRIGRLNPSTIETWIYIPVSTLLLLPNLVFSG